MSQDAASKWYYQKMLADMQARISMIETHVFSDALKNKPEPKPDVVMYGVVEINGVALFNSRFDQVCDNLRLTFDGETGKLKSAEVL